MMTCESAEHDYMRSVFQFESTDTFWIVENGFVAIICQEESLQNKQICEKNDHSLFFEVNS